MKTMIAFGFALWVIAALLVNRELSTPRGPTTFLLSNILFVSCAAAYVFWGIGWGLSRVADMVYSVL